MNRTPTQTDISGLPPGLRELAAGCPLYDSSCSEQARVLFLDRDGGLFLKTAPAGELSYEAGTTEYFHSLGLSARVLSYETWEGRDFLLTERIPGEDCTYRRYLDDPVRLCDTTAGLLRKLHSVDFRSCPVTDRLDRYRASVEKGLSEKHFEADLFSGIWDPGSFGEACAAAAEGMECLTPDALIHGDYCLPNIILDDWRFSGFIDLGQGGIGDRHIDILWGTWTLRYNLHTSAYTSRFLDAYGRDLIDEEKLRLIAAMETISN